jgi:hypothetical protein
VEQERVRRRSPLAAPLKTPRHGMVRRHRPSAWLPGIAERPGRNRAVRSRASLRAACAILLFAPSASQGRVYLKQIATR